MKLHHARLQPSMHCKWLFHIQTQVLQLTQWNVKMYLTQHLRLEITKHSFINYKRRYATIMFILFSILNNIQMNVVIHGESIQFIQIDHKNANTGRYFVDTQKRYFLKKVFPIYVQKIKNEVYFLKRLEQYNCFPKLLLEGPDFIVTTYAGEDVSSNLLPNNYELQIAKILAILNYENIVTDTKKEHFTVKNGILSLVDFGEAEVKQPNPGIVNRITTTHRLPPNLLGYEQLHRIEIIKQQLKK